MSYNRMPPNLLWESSHLTWSPAIYPAVDESLGAWYLDYPRYDYRLDDTQVSRVSSAFDAWAAVSGISFGQSADEYNVNIRIGIDAIDGPGGALAHAVMWWNGQSRMMKAAIAFDSADMGTAWMGMGPPPAGTWSFYTTAVHEIGHTIGIDHINIPTAVMYPYANSTTALTTYDIAEAVARYGLPADATPTPAPAPAPAVSDVVTGVLADTKPGGVDETFYLTKNPDVANAGLDAIVHFNLQGWKEGRDPAPWFDTSWYLQSSPDVTAAGINPFEHFLANGQAEGRRPNEWFDPQGYLLANPDVAAAGLNPLTHYWNDGWREGRKPSDQFDGIQYLDANPDVKLAGINPLEHWILYGQAEGRALA